jgi:hypothetical protein
MIEELELKPYKTIKLVHSDFNFTENFFVKNNSDLIHAKLKIRGEPKELTQLISDLKDEAKDAIEQNAYCCHFHLYKRDFKESEHSDNLFLLVKFWANMGFNINYQHKDKQLTLFAS